MLLVVCGFVACDKDRAGSMDVSGSCRVEKFVLNDKYEGAIDIPNKQIKVKVPVDFNTKNDMVVTSMQIPAEAQSKTFSITAIILPKLAAEHVLHPISAFGVFGEDG